MNLPVHIFYIRKVYQVTYRNNGSTILQYSMKEIQAFAKVQIIHILVLMIQIKAGKETPAEFKPKLILCAQESK